MGIPTVFLHDLGGGSCEVSIDTLGLECTAQEQPNRRFLQILISTLSKLDSEPPGRAWNNFQSAPKCVALTGSNLA